MSRFQRWILGGLGLALAAVILAPAAADWLVTKDGTRVETQGPWRVESRLVVFKRPDGTFASMRLSEVDLEASERVTREMAEARRAAAAENAERQRPTERREPVARLTEKDLPPVESRASSGPDGESEGAGSGDPPRGREDAQPVAVSTWREVTEIDGDGTAFVGELQNTGENMALGVGVEVTLFDSEDEVIATKEAVLTGSALPPGKSGGFRAEFPGVFHYARVDFEVGADIVEAQTEDADEPPSR